MEDKPSHISAASTPRMMWEDRQAERDGRHAAVFAIYQRNGEKDGCGTYAKRDKPRICLLRGRSSHVRRELDLSGWMGVIRSYNRSERRGHVVHQSADGGRRRDVHGAKKQQHHQHTHDGRAWGERCDSLMNQHPTTGPDTESGGGHMGDDRGIAILPNRIADMQAATEMARMLVLRMQTEVASFARWNLHSSACKRVWKEKRRRAFQVDGGSG